MYTRCVKTGSAVEPEGAPYNQVSMLQIIIGVVRTFFCFRFVLSLSVCLSVCLSQCLSVLCPEVILCIWRDIKIQELSVCLTSWGDCNWWDVKKHTLSLSVCLVLVSVSLSSWGDPVKIQELSVCQSVVLRWPCWWEVKIQELCLCPYVSLTRPAMILLMDNKIQEVSPSSCPRLSLSLLPSPPLSAGLCEWCCFVVCLLKANCF